MKNIKSIKSNKGFSLVMALIAIAILGVITMGIAKLFNSFNAQSRHFNSVSGARTLVSTLQGFISYPNLCIANLDPSTQVFGSTQITQAATIEGVPLSFQLGGGSTGPKVEANSLLRSYDVVVQKLNFRNAAAVGNDPLTGNTLYSGELYLQLQKRGQASEVAGGIDLKEKGVGTLILSVDSTTNTIMGCYALVDARKACDELGGTYNDSTTPRCRLAYPCAGIPNSMFMGYDASGTAQCKTMAQIVGALCPSGQYLVSDGSGGATCAGP